MLGGFLGLLTQLGDLEPQLLRQLDRQLIGHGAGAKSVYTEPAHGPFRFALQERCSRSTAALFGSGLLLSAETISVITRMPRVATRRRLRGARQREVRLDGQQSEGSLQIRLTGLSRTQYRPHCFPVRLRPDS